MVRKLLGIVAGVVIALVTITLVEFAGHAVFPPPAGQDMRDPAAVTAYLATAPVGAMLFVVAGWFAGALAGGLGAATIARWPAAAWIIAGLIALAGIYNATQIPAPLWMQAATVLAPALGGWTARHLARRNIA